jgi:DNA polymerase III alpha subunit
MSKKIIHLSDRHITTNGEVVFTYDGLLKLARDGRNFHDYLVEKDKYTDLYNKYGSTPLSYYEEGENETFPSVDLYQWNTPEPYSSIDLEEYCAEQLVNHDLTNDQYLERLSIELQEFEARGMVELTRHLIYLKDHFVSNGVVWGVGRGSSCASLVLYLLGINKIDPILYDIPMNEFLR